MLFKDHDDLLTCRQVADLLQLPEATILRWEQQGKIPGKINDGLLVFRKSEILHWAGKHDLAVQKDIKLETADYRISAAIRAGGIHRNIKGSNSRVVFSNIINQLNFIPNGSKDTVISEMVSREELASTGIGNGIAIPHTRERLNFALTEPVIALCFLNETLEFNAIDNLPVSILFMLFTTSVKCHLKMLSKISFILQDSKIRDYLIMPVDEEKLLSRLVEIEDEV